MARYRRLPKMRCQGKFALRLCRVKCRDTHHNDIVTVWRHVGSGWHSYPVFTITMYSLWRCVRAISNASSSATRYVLTVWFSTPTIDWFHTVWDHNKNQACSFRNIGEIWNSLREGVHLYQTQSNAIILRNTLPAMYREGGDQEKNYTAKHINVFLRRKDLYQSRTWIVWTPRHYKIRRDNVRRSFWQARWNVQRNLSR